MSTTRAGAKSKIHWDLIGLTNTKTSQKWKENWLCLVLVLDDMDIIYYEHLEQFHLYNMLLPKNFPKTPGGFSAQATIPAQTSNVSKTLAKSWQNFHLNFWRKNFLLISLIARHCKCWMNLHPRKLTWNLKMMVFHRNLLFYRGSFSGSMLVFGGVPRKASNKKILGCLLTYTKSF